MHAFCEVLQIYGLTSFFFSFQGNIRNLIILVHDQYLSFFYFEGVRII